MTKKALSRLAAGCLCLAAAPESECGDLAADTVVADRVETPAIGPSAALSGVSLSADAAVSGALSVAGGTALRSGIPCLAPLGDVPMGCFTNAPGDAACADSPAWWAARGVTAAGAAANDRAAAVQGQVKWIALQAAAEFDAGLAAAGGAGPAVSALVASFSPSNNLLPVTLGQLKNTAKPFHDRLIEIGLAAGYPWSGPASDFALANAGQVKFLFSFDLARDSDGDGMPDVWEVANGLDPLSGLSDTLAGWWQFREGSRTNSMDLSGNGNDAFILFPDKVSWTPGAPVGGALRFDTNTVGVSVGSNGGYVCVPGLSNAVLSSGFTAAAWVRAESYPPYATVLTKTGDHNVWGDGFSLYHEPGDSLSFYTGSWGEDTVAGGVSGTGVWHHVCGVYDGTDALLYIDGTLRGTRTNVAGAVANDDPLWIGSVFKDDRWLWHGDIADVRFYTSALSASQVNGLLEFAADPDGDGVPNLQEYARGTDPGDPASKNCTLYADSDIGGAQYDGFSPAVLSASRGPKATVQQALDTAFSGDAVELRGQSAFADAVLSPGDKRLILRPAGGVRF